MLVALLPFHYLQDTIGRSGKCLLIPLEIIRGRQRARPSNGLEIYNLVAPFNYAGFLK